MTCSGLTPLRLAHPQTPTTTPLYRRVAKNPHIGHRHHGHKSVTRDGRCGESGWVIIYRLRPHAQHTCLAWGLRVDVLGAKAPAPVTFGLMVVGVVDRFSIHNPDPHP